MNQCSHFDGTKGSGDIKAQMSKLFERVSIARIKDEDFFWETHSRIILFHLDKGSSEGKTIVGEEDVLTRITGERKGNHTSLIFGKPGIGKSELCAYLYLKLKKTHDPNSILYLDRTQSQSDILRTVSERYQQLSGKPLPGNNMETVEDIRRDPNNWAPGFYTEIINNLKEACGPNLADAFSRDQDAIAEFTTFIASRLSKLMQKSLEGDTPRERDFLEPGMLDLMPNFRWALKFKTHIDNHEEVYSLINNAFDISFRRITNTVDLRTALQQLSNLLKSRIFIIFEDFHLSSTEEREIANFMESTGQEAYACEFVVAGPRQNLKALETQTGLERHDFYQLEGEDKGCTFVSPETASAFLSSYTSYWKRKIRDVDCEVCSQIEASENESEAILFPFNSAFIKNAYKNMKNQSPRNLVLMAYDMLRDHLAGVPPFKSSALLRYSKSPGEFSFDADNEIEILMAWYAKSENGELKLNAIYKQLFGVLAQSPSVIERGEYLVFVPERIVETEEGEEPEDESDVENQIGNWRAHPSDFPDPGIYIEIGARLAMKYLSNGWQIIDDWAEVGGPQITFQTSDPVSFSSLHPKDINFDPKVFKVSQLKSLHKLGENKSNPEEALGKVPSIMLYALDGWRKKKWRNLIDTEINKSNHMQFSRFIVVSALLISAVKYPFEPVGSDSLAKTFIRWRKAKESTDDADESISDSVSGVLDLTKLVDEETLDDSETGAELNRVLASPKQIVASTDSVFAMLQALGTYDGGVLDMERLEFTEGFDPLEAIGRIKLKKAKSAIGNEYRVDDADGGLKVDDVIDSVVKNARDIHTYHESCASNENFNQDAKTIMAWIKELDDNSARFKSVLEQIQSISSISDLARSLEEFRKNVKAADSDVTKAMLRAYVENPSFDWLQDIRRAIIRVQPTFISGMKLINSSYFDTGTTTLVPDKSQRMKILKKLVEALEYV